MTKKLILYLPVFLIIPILIKAQFVEHFSNGNFTTNPVWIGNTSSWIVNSANQLQSNNTTANSTFYLSTASTLATTAQWEFYVDLKFATSGANYTDVYLTASSSDITAITTTGYFIRIGNTTDEISLYRKDADVATGTKIIDGVDGSVSSSTNNQVKIKVIRNAQNQWTLLRDLTGTGNTFFSEGNVTDATFTTSAYFGILVKQSSVASFAQKHFYDDIVVKPYNPDVTPPTIEAVKVIAANSLDVLFNEPLDVASSQNTSNYFIDNSIGNAATATLDAGNNALVHLTFINNFPDAINCTITINNVQDKAGNTIINGTAGFTYFAPYIAKQYDVIIDEIMAAPTPAISLPTNEWVELKNTSVTPINLLGWTITNHQLTSGGMPNFILKPDSFVIVCAASAVSAMASYGTTISVTKFPSLINDADQLSLQSAQTKTIHAVSYSSTWYQNDLKKNGGWSLEMIDTKNPCSGISNWKASTDLRGGSPGTKNSVDAINPDINSPKLLRGNAIDNLTIKLVFDEPLDSLKAVTLNNYTISDGIGLPISVVAIAPLFNVVNLTIGTPLVATKMYTVTVNGITDCVGNTIDSKNSARVGISSVADSIDVVINEILYNPPSNGSDYVELYNRSNKIIDLKQTYIANRNTSGAVSSITQITADNYLLFPQDYVLLATDVSFIKKAYITLNPDGFIALKLPVYSNDKSSVVLLNAQGNITDEVDYNDKWQFKLLANTEGVSLERIDFNSSSQSADNWHSAATSVGYGTPGYKNSQYKINEEVQGDLKITPAIISPDNDGQDDFATIEYNFPEQGYVANITIFDAQGRPVRYLQRSALCGTKGNFRWDGLGEKNQSLATGIYIIYTSIFNLQGKTKQFKIPIVLTRRN